MQYFFSVFTLHINKLGCMIFAVLILSSCGGGNGNHASTIAGGASSVLLKPRLSSISNSASSGTSASASSAISSSAVNANNITLSGRVTYDFVPHNVNHIGLNYLAIEQRPARGVVVELLNDIGQTQATTLSNNDGDYTFQTQKNILVKVRVRAQIINNTSPTWKFTVTDNTDENAPYVLDGGLASTGAQNSQRNLNADSGWDGVSYSQPRAAAPFAILDDIYLGVHRLILAGNTQNLSPLELRWSTKNSTADDDISKGEIGTSFFNGDAIYILGDANSDTDEYDSHVLMHEWGHYLEQELFRSDSTGGYHSGNDRLDMRVAMSEGFADAFSGIMLDDVNYEDASGIAQASGFTFDISKKSQNIKGYFSESSIASLIYNYYKSQLDKINDKSNNLVADGFTPIFKILTNTSYKNSDVLVSIYLFYQQLINQFPEDQPSFSALLQEQHIFGSNLNGAGETNDGGLAITLPIYKVLIINGAAINVCSAADYGKFNKLGNSEFVKVNIPNNGAYDIHVKKTGAAILLTKPEFILYKIGKTILRATNVVNDNNSSEVNLTSGNYIIDIYDVSNHDVNNVDKNTICFDVNVSGV